jgi:hypothetical protein
MFQRMLRAGMALCLVAVTTANVLAEDGPIGHKAADLSRSHVLPIVTGTIRGLAQASQRRDGALVAHTPITGSGKVRAGHVIIENVLSPGDSPGCIDFGGNVTFNATATLLIELGGTTPCIEYDRITVTNTLTLNGPTLEVVLINSFPPQYGDRFDALDWGTLIGTFGNIDTSAASLPFPLVWDSSDLYLTGELVVGVLPISDGDLAPWNSPNGQINAGDMLIATQLVLGQRIAGPLQLAHGDMNLDGIFDLADLLLIQQIVLP